MGKLDGKVAVITGATSGMALAGANLFVDEGAHVFITGRRKDVLDEAVKLIGRNVTGVQRVAPGLPRLECVRREQGRAARLRTSVGVRAEGQEHPGERADPRPGRHADDDGGDGRGDEGAVRVRDPAARDGPPWGD